MLPDTSGQIFWLVSVSDSLIDLGPSSPSGSHWQLLARYA